MNIVFYVASAVLLVSIVAIIGGLFWEKRIGHYFPDWLGSLLLLMLPVCVVVILASGFVLSHQFASHCHALNGQVVHTNSGSICIRKGSTIRIPGN